MQGHDNFRKMILIVLLLGWVFLGEFGPGDVIDSTIVNGETCDIYYDSTAKNVLFLSDTYSVYAIGKDENLDKWIFYLHSKKYKIRYLGLQKIEVLKEQ